MIIWYIFLVGLDVSRHADPPDSRAEDDPFLPYAYFLACEGLPAQKERPRLIPFHTLDLPMPLIDAAMLHVCVCVSAARFIRVLWLPRRILFVIVYNGAVLKYVLQR